ncbi:hypothetical protein HDU76_011651, partial [Blyttiomyces sp. JEL0837]
AKGKPTMAKLESISIENLWGRDKRFSSFSYLKVLKAYGNSLTRLYLIDDRITSWYQILEGEKSLIQTGNVFSRLQVVTLMLSYDYLNFNKETVIQEFVDFLPPTVIEIRVGGAIQFCKSDNIGVLERFANRGGIKVVVGKFRNPPDLI